MIWYTAQVFNNQLHYDMIRINAYNNRMSNSLQTIFKSCIFLLGEIENGENILLWQDYFKYSKSQNLLLIYFI